MVHHLLRVEDGETEQEALEKWWKKNGLDSDKAREQRREEYIRQLKEAAIAMDRFKQCQS